MNQPNLPQFFKVLNLLFIFFLSGQVLFGGVIWWLLLEQGSDGGQFFSSRGLLALVALGWSIFTATLLYKRRLEKGARLGSLLLKLSHYRTSCIFRWGLIELGNLVVIAIAFSEGNSQLMLLFAAGIAVFFLTRPSEENFRNEYLGEG